MVIVIQFADMQVHPCTIGRLCKEGIVWVEDFTGKVVEPLTTNTRTLWKERREIGSGWLRLASLSWTSPYMVCSPFLLLLETEW